MSSQRLKNRYGDEIALETEEIEQFKGLINELERSRKRKKRSGGKEQT